jgi:hypothetical protein
VSPAAGFDEHGRDQHRTLRSPLDDGTRRRSGDATTAAGTWEVVDHDGCAAAGTLRAFAEGDELPPCPSGDHAATWQLTHLSATVAADHQNTTPLP